MNPPYKMTNLPEVLEEIASMKGLIDDEGILVVGHSKHLDLLPGYGRLRLISHRRYGDNVVDFFGHCDEEVVDGNSPVSG